MSIREAGTGRCDGPIKRYLPWLVAVALFMDDEPGWIEEVVSGVQPDVLQFHGNESDGFAASFSRPYIKALPMASIADASRQVAAYPGASGILLDSHARGARGGTGETFDWTRIPAGTGRPFVLAGGLAAHNVAHAIATVRPYAVDVSSGVEETLRVKSRDKVLAFVEAVRTADQV